MKRQVVIPYVHGTSADADEHRLNDRDTKAERIDTSNTPLVVRPHVVCRFWLEKFLVLIDGAQIYAIMWQLSQPWPWPARWLRWSRWTNAFNGDVFSFRSTGAAMGATNQSFSLWGEMEGYWVYALLWGLLPYTTLGALQIARYRWKKHGIQDLLDRKAKWENVLLQVFQILYLPIGLAVLRLVNCNANGEVSVDPTTMGKCRGIRHSVAVALITGALGGTFLVGFPWLLHRLIHRYLVHSDVEHHERFLQAKELEFMLNTSETYLGLYMPQYASFQRHSVGTPVHLLLLKLSMLVIFSLLRSLAPYKTNQGLQGTLFFVLLSIYAVRCTWYKPYRMVTSSRLALIVDWMLVTNGIFVLLCANGVRSALTVSTTLTSSLTFVNVCFLIVLGLSFLQNIQQWKFGSQNVLATALRWPSNEHMDAIVLYRSTLAMWVDTIKDAKKVVVRSLLVPPCMRNYQDLGRILYRLEVCHGEAIAEEHLLSDQFYELLRQVHELYVEALGSNPFHRLGFPEFPENDLSDLGGVLKRRKERQLLAPSSRQRVLMKLDIARSWWASTVSKGLGPKRDTGSFRALLESSTHHYISTYLSFDDWEEVNVLLELQRLNSVDENVISVQVERWSPTGMLIQGVLDQNEQTNTEEMQLIASLNDLHRLGVQMRVVHCEYPHVNAAILTAIANLHHEPPSLEASFHHSSSGTAISSELGLANSKHAELQELISLTDDSTSFKYVLDKFTL